MGVFTKDSGSEKDRSPKRAQPYDVLRPITASASILKANSKSDIEALKDRKASQKWQEEAWEYFDAIGEIKYAFNLFSNILSRIRIHAAYVEDDQDTPTPIKVSNASEQAKAAADAAMRKVFGGGKQAEILRKASLNLLVVGECYLINEKRYIGSYQEETWRVVSTDQLASKDGGFYLKSRRNMKVSDAVLLPPDTFMGRIWKEHPRYSDEPDSSMRALCDICAELLLLSRAVRATAKSRLNAGAFFVPDEFSVTQEVTSDESLDDDGLEAYVEDERDEFEDQLMAAMTLPIADEDSAAAVVPLLIRGPAEAGDKIRVIKFERSFDPQLVNRADRALERILQGIDLPKEIVTGLAQIKYSNAIQINESFYTSHIEPMVIMLCDVFRTVYYRPALIKAGVDPEEVERMVIWYDPSGITTAPDKSTAANVGYDKGALNEEAWRNANGFSEDDAPTAMERVFRIALQRGPVTPELMDTVLRELIPDILAKTRANTLAQSGAPIPGNVENLINPGAQAPPTNPEDPLGDPGGVPEGAQAPPADPLADAGPPTEASAPDATPSNMNLDFADGFIEDVDTEAPPESEV